MAKFTTIKVGQPLSLDDLKRKPAPRGHRLNPRDEDLARLVNEVSVGAVSQVLPWHYDGKAARTRRPRRPNPRRTPRAQLRRPSLRPQVRDARRASSSGVANCRETGWPLPVKSAAPHARSRSTRVRRLSWPPDETRRADRASDPRCWSSPWPAPQLTGDGLWGSLAYTRNAGFRALRARRAVQLTRRPQAGGVRRPRPRGRVSTRRNAR